MNVKLRLKINNFLEKISIYFISKIYRKYLIKLKPKNTLLLCRFHPTCSEYSILAIEKYGFLRGWSKSINRIYRCRPSNTKSVIDYP
jgi:putative membrane protein insertion efficiency factor